MSIIALCSELKAGDTAPEWIELLPAGPDITGRDGRQWRLSNPQKVADAFNQQNIALVVDYEHSSEVLAPSGTEAPAAGWIERVEVRDDGSVWGFVDWTEKANNSITSKEYRYISPAFTHSSDGEIKGLSSVALTNKPNLKLKALNSQQDWSEVAMALNIENISSPQDVLNALNREKNDSVNKIVDAVIEQAVFCPAQREHLVSLCSQIGEKQFKAFADAQLAAHGKMVNTGSSAQPNPTRNGKSLTDNQLAVCRNTGVSREDYITALGKYNV
ncbi:phage protease [Citrobacter freundii]|uniref:phage protease n=1 Tax=Citrobacter freundii TaxID=546 RepID=UPI001C3A1F93|nr:phage protease [Citrobacter freundii]MDE9645332.1 phage protease [Citrobacter freundii]MDE9695861.1 phage protease [Citrobacter freundii]MDE9699635.1 phage protease [Citrobacter freundii]MEB0809210.1 phage protease [Citrobacter freundii]HBH6853136.1 hypothetical protein [Citrobacter freundii]